MLEQQVVLDIPCAPSTTIGKLDEICAWDKCRPTYRKRIKFIVYQMVFEGVELAYRLPGDAITATLFLRTCRADVYT